LGDNESLNYDSNDYLNNVEFYRIVAQP